MIDFDESRGKKECVLCCVCGIRPPFFRFFLPHPFHKMGRESFEFCAFCNSLVFLFFLYFVRYDRRIVCGGLSDWGADCIPISPPPFSRVFWPRGRRLSAHACERREEREYGGKEREGDT